MSPRPTRHVPTKAKRAHLAPANSLAPIHRGPQAALNSLSGTPIHHHPNAALLIDFDNVTMGIRSDLQTELRNLLSSAIVKGKVAVQRAYADWRRYPQYIVPMYESSIDLIYAPAYGSAKKNATDIRLAIDALELVFTRPEIGTFILLSGDSDFSSLVIKLKEYGKYVIGVGIRESSSDLLVQNCDEYYSYNALAGLVKFGDEENVKRDPWELVGEAIERMQRNGDVMRADRLKQVMQQIDNSFDEKDLGMAKFSRFVSEAASKGLLTLTKLENGQFEVGPAKKNGEAVAAVGEVAAVSPSVAPARKEGERPSRGRRGGRGGRGGRDREVAAARVVEPVSEPAPVVEQESTEIGSSGTRLTREEAFNLVRRSVESLVKDGEKPRATAVRAAARQILGRDSESLSEKNFIRILQDAHAGDIIDLRKRGNDYEVDLASAAPPVTEQLAKNAPVTKTPGPTATPARAGSVPRGRGPIGGKRGEIPADLFSVGVVPSWGDSEPKVVDEPAAEIPETVEAEEPVKAKRPSRPRRPRKTATEGEVSAAPKRTRKPRASATETE
jgi:uncharacterized protein (TIGR00288 family)